MRKLNRVIAAGALAVPMALGASGIAVAAEGSSGVQNQVEAAEGDGSGSEDDILDLDQGGEDSSDDEGDFLEFIEDLLEELLGGNDEGNSGNDTGNDSILGGNDEGNSGNDTGNDSSGLLGIG